LPIVAAGEDAERNLEPALVLAATAVILAVLVSAEDVLQPLVRVERVRLGPERPVDVLVADDAVHDHRLDSFPIKKVVGTLADSVPVLLAHEPDPGEHERSADILPLQRDLREVHRLGGDGLMGDERQEVLVDELSEILASSVVERGG